MVTHIPRWEIPCLVLGRVCEWDRWKEVMVTGEGDVLGRSRGVGMEERVAWGWPQLWDSSVLLRVRATAGTNEYPCFNGRLGVHCRVPLSSSVGQPGCPFGVGAVSYTHLDVYKRQEYVSVIGVYIYMCNFTQNVLKQKLLLVEEK